MKYLLLITMTALLLHQQAYSQVEVAPWGNITGIRKQGQLFNVQTNLQFIKKGGNQIINTTREQQKPVYTRNGNMQTVTTGIDSLLFEKAIINNGDNKAQIIVKLTSKTDTTMLGAFLVVRIPQEFDNLARFKLKDNDKKFEVASIPTNAIKDLAGVMAKGFEYKSNLLEVKVKTAQPDSVLVRKDENNGDILVYFTLRANDIKKGETIQKSYELEAKGKIDKAPVNLTLNTAQQGRKFDGLGGNFRLQNPTTDQQVIDYSLENLRLAWGRVEMPWKFWQPEKDVNPLDAAQANRLPEQVTQAMEMAQRLSKKGIPVILSVWSAPDWAITGTPNTTPVNGVWGNPLNKDVMTDIYRSIARYITCLRDNYGVEVKYFSFNESDLGINIRMTAQEHADFIKGFGSYMNAKGLGTKLLLGDNSDASTWAFLNTAIADTATHPYIGAISFHSWRGWETEILQKWANVATKLNVPLLVGEGSIDAAAWQYPAIFQEPVYAMEEINLYTRLLAICQPASILQWQLTADYSPLAGGGIFGDNGPLRPTQRFWNLKQLSSTPKDLYAMPAKSSRTDVSVAALGNNSTGVYTIHLVNNGADRQATITGIPARVEKLKIYITNQEASVKSDGEKKVSNGQLKFKLPARSFITLSNNQ